MRRRLAAAVALTACLGAAPRIVDAAQAFSTDGEATVYRNGAFNGPFTLVYNAHVRAESHNKSWSTLSLTLLGGAPPADGITIGLAPDGAGGHVFTSTVRNGKNVFHDTGRVCSSTCSIGLRGDRGTLVAVLAGTTVGAWPRFAFSMPHPAVQLNAEVAAPGDRIDGRLQPVIERTAHGRLPFATCAFTTQGVLVSSYAGGFAFHGSFEPGAPAYYLDLKSRRPLPRCVDP